MSVLRAGRRLYGLATAASGFGIAGAIGWTVRIVFTLIFGREAFGAGDIHLMAATGAVAGWPVVLMGFLLSCLLALVGWVAGEWLGEWRVLVAVATCGLAGPS